MSTAKPEILVAAAFCRALKDRLTEEELAHVVELNHREANPGICHSHNYCDANEVMSAAFKDALGYEPCETGGERPDTLASGGCMNDESLRIWKTAWSIAASAEFDPEQVASAVPGRLSHAAYVAAGGNCCPFCRSEDVSGDGVEIDGAKAFQEVNCNACGEWWTDIYSLSGYTFTPAKR